MKTIGEFSTGWGDDYPQGWSDRVMDDLVGVSKGGHLMVPTFRPFDFLEGPNKPLTYMSAKSNRIAVEAVRGAQPMFHRNADFDEVFFQWAGETTYETEWGVVTAKPAELMLLPSGVAHRAIGSAGCLRMSIRLRDPVEVLIDETHHIDHTEYEVAWRGGPDWPVPAGAPDESGRPAPVPVPGSQVIVPCDTVIAAVGEICDLSFLPHGIGMNANIRYVSGYADPLSGTCYALFPLTGAGTLVTQMTGKRSLFTLSWFEDLRVGQTVDLARIVEERLTELGLASGTVGLVGIIFRSRENVGLPWNLLEEIKKRLPNLKIVDVTDLFFELRSVKSDEEIRCLENSAQIADVGFEAHVNGYRAGMTEREYYAAIVHAMDAAGAEPPTFLLLESGPLFQSWLTQDPIPSNRLLSRGDYIVSEASPKWAGYQARGLQCTVLGKPTPEMKELVKYGVEVWHRVTDLIRPGNTIEQAEHCVDDIIEKARARLGDYAGGLLPHCSYAGLGGPDPFPRPREIQPNQAFMGEIGPYSGRSKPRPPWRMNGGYCLISTEGAPRHLNGKHSIEERLMVVID
jgi:Xaa-Pro aminopeptidase